MAKGRVQYATINNFLHGGTCNATHMMRTRSWHGSGLYTWFQEILNVLFMVQRRKVGSELRSDVVPIKSLQKEKKMCVSVVVGRRVERSAFTLKYGCFLISSTSDKRFSDSQQNFLMRSLASSLTTTSSGNINWSFQLSIFLEWKRGCCWL